MLSLKFKRLKPETILPKYAHATDAAFDLCSTENYVLKPGERRVFFTGLAAEIPEGHFVWFRGRSSLATKAGLEVMAGIIDSEYRGDWGVILINLGSEPYEIKVGDRIAQAILLPVNHPEISEVEELPPSGRGEGRFGSTGR
jgi:dUTP pyrophosphatase